MRYYLIAGEASGDLHGANLIAGLKKSDPQAEFRFWGGDKMAAEAGANALAMHYKKNAFFGFTQVVMNARTILSQIKQCKADILDYAPDVVILIDYPGFNFKIAKFAHERGLKTFYYISPKVWAWKESRVKQIKRYVDKLFIIFPFEVEYFRERGIETIYEGNPLVDAIEQKRGEWADKETFCRRNALDPQRPIVALLAGSRASEIGYNLPFMASLAERFPDYQFVVGGVSWLDRSLYDKAIGEGRIAYVKDQTYELLANAQAAVVTSGTATLETALIGTPEVVCYRMDPLTAAIGRMVVKIRFISLVNLIMDREVVRELIQGDMTIENAETELRAIMPDGAKHSKMTDDYAALRDVVGGSGASERFAARMVEILKQNN